MPEEESEQVTPEQPEGEGQANMLNPGESDFLRDPAFDRFRKENGEVDTAKLGKSYRELEKKMGKSGDPEMETPESPEDYEIASNLPEGMDPESVGIKEIVSELHKRNANKAVVKYVTEAYTNLISQGTQLQSQQAEIKAKETETHLKEVWGADFNRELTRAQLAFKAVADENDMKNSGELASNPAVMRLLAKLGRKLEEDSPVQSGTGIPQEELNSMMKSEAYWNAKHPDHEKVKGMVSKHFQNAYRK